MTSRDEDQQLRSIFRALGVVDEWESLTGGSVPSGKWRIEPGSDLAEDDQQSHPYEVSHAAWAALSAGVSHLACLRDSLFAQTGPASFQARLHTHGQFTLVRGALENASRAVWLLEPDDRKVRLLRRFQQEWAEARQLDEVAREMGKPTKGKAERLAKLSPLAQNANIDPDLIKKGPDYTTIVRAAGRHPRSGPAVAVVLWKACSSLAHGEVRGQINYLTKEVLGESAPGVALTKVTGNVLLLNTGVLVSMGITKTALDLYAKRSGMAGA